MKHLPGWIIPAALALLLSALTAGCVHFAAGHRLAEAEALIDSRPDSALAILRAIPRADLHGEHRARHALLSVKATDRMYIPHTSDSAALIALDYYGDRDAGLRTVEAHYYIGRVCYDLKDYPRALKGFHQALRSLEDTGDSSLPAMKLRGALLSQQGQLLTELRLYSESRPFYKDAILTDSILGDTLNLFYDIRELAFTYIEEHNCDSARIALKRALPLSRGLNSSSETEIYSLLALSYLKDKQYTRAAEFIDSIDPHVNPDENSLTLSVIAQIYYKTGQRDSAAHYARPLLQKPSPENQVAARRILARNSLRSGNPDTIAAYHDSVANFAVDMLGEHARGLNLPGTMFYRLMTTELDNSRLQAQNSRLTLSVLLLALLAAACIIIILAALYRRSYRRQKDTEAMSQIQHVIYTHTPHSTGLPMETPTTDDPRELLVRTLLERMESLANAPCQIPGALRDSAVVRRLKEMCRDDQPLDVSSPLWGELEEGITLVSPDFRSAIHLLLGNPSVNDYHIALLIKADFTPTEIALLLARSKGTISSNRQRMCERIFKRKISNTLFDRIIRTI